MTSFFIDRLSPFTEEEERLLAGGDLEKKLYTATKDFVVSAMRLSRGREIAVRAHTRFISFPEHTHNYAETMLVLAGHITHTIGERTLTLGAGDILFMNKHVAHAVERAGADDIGVNLIVSDAFLDRLAERMSSTVFSSFIEENAREHGAPAYLCFHTAGVRQLENLEENMLSEITGCEQDPQILSDTFALLLTCLSKGRDDLLFLQSRGMSREEARRTEILAYVRENSQHGSLDDLARRLSLTPTYLSALVSRLCGDSLHHLFLRERLARAARLLTESELPIAKILLAVGFDSPSYFHRTFRERYGTTPFAYRAEKRKKSIAPASPDECGLSRGEIPCKADAGTKKEGGGTA